MGRNRVIIDMKPRERVIRWPSIYRDCEAILNAITGEGCTQPVCPCCAQHIRASDPEDGAFCWDCGLYAHDKRDDCDNPEHR